MIVKPKRSVLHVPTFLILMPIDKYDDELILVHYKKGSKYKVRLVIY